MLRAGLGVAVLALAACGGANRDSGKIYQPSDFLGAEFRYYTPPEARGLPLGRSYGDLTGTGVRPLPY